MTLAYGNVLAVTDEVLGGRLTAASPSTDTTLNLDFLADFKDTGTVLMLGDNAVSEEKTYSTVNRATNVLTLDSGLANSYAAGDFVQVQPQQIRRFAWVQTGSGPTSILIALVPIAMRDTLAPGVRADGEREAVVVDVENQVLVDAPELLPNIDGVEVPSFGTDGSPPGSSPTPSVQGGVGYLAVRWSPVSNNDTTTYEVHISTTTGFTPSGATLAGEVAGTIMFVRRMPDNSILQYETTYYVKLIAKDADGSAAASAQASAQLVPANTADIAVGAIVANNILSGTITAEQMQSVLTITNQFVAGTPGGQRVEIDSDGVRLVAASGAVMVNLPVDPDTPASFAGALTASSITISDQLRLQGNDNVISTNADLFVAEGTATPTTPPSMSYGWEELALSDSGTLPRRGLCYDANGTAGGATPVFLYCENGVGGRLIEANASTGVLTRSHSFNATSPYQQPLGATRVGSFIYVLYAETSATLIWVPGYWSGRTYIPGHYESSEQNTMKIRKITQSSFATSSDTTLSSTDVPPLDSGNVQSGIGTDGTYVCVITEVSKAAVPQVVRYNASTMALNDKVNLTGFNSSGLLNNASFYSMVVAETGKWWITLYSASANHGGTTDPEIPYSCLAFNSSGVYQSNLDFGLGGAVMAGTTHDGTQFRTILESAVLLKHTNWVWTTESAKYWAGYSWYDSVGTTHETPVSQIASMTHLRRARMNVSVLGDIPGAGGADDPDSFRVYLNRGSTMPTGGTPTRFSGYLQGASSSTLVLTTFDNAGSPPENTATNDFPASPATIQSEGGEWQLLGDGTKVGFSGSEAFGDGSDGAAVFDGSSTVLGLAPSSNVYTLTRDLYCTDITINNGVTILPANFRIFCRGTLQNSGTIKGTGTVGSNGSGTTGGGGGANAATVGSTYGIFNATGAGGGAGGNAGANGANGNSPTIGTGTTTGWRFGGGLGGTSDVTGAGGAGSAAGTSLADSSPTAGQGGFRHVTALTELLTRGSSAVYAVNFGAAASGGAGGTAGTSSGGGGGGGGGSFFIAAKTVLNSGVIEAKGGNGGNGVGLGAGGGGGGGGFIGVVYDTYSGSDPVVTAGTGGTKGTGFAPSAPTLGPTINNTTDATSFATGTVAVASGQHYLIAVNNAVSSGTPNTPSMSGTNGWNATYTQIATQVWGTSSLRRLTLFRVTGSSGTSGVITAAFAGQTQTGCEMLTLSSGSGNWTSETPTQSATPATGSTGNASITLGATPATISGVIGFMADETTSANVSPGSGYQESTELNQATGAGTLEAEYVTIGTVPGSSVTWTNTSGQWVAMAVEMPYAQNTNGTSGSNGLVIKIAV